MLYHGRPGTEYDATFWQALHALQDRIWPQMSTRIEAARKLGVHWEAVTTPFVWVEENRALAHVGVIAHPLRLLGENCLVARIHAVCTDPDARGRGLGRRCMDAALAWIDERFDLVKLSTTIPAFYGRWGFSVVPTHRFVAQRAGGAGPARPATLDDTARICALLSSRTPTSDVYATRDPGWLPIIDLALQRRPIIAEALPEFSHFLKEGHAERFGELLPIDISTFAAAIREFCALQDMVEVPEPSGKRTGIIINISHGTSPSPVFGFDPLTPPPSSPIPRYPKRAHPVVHHALQEAMAPAVTLPELRNE